jgi:large subunit ribosomal protein L2
MKIYKSITPSLRSLCLIDHYLFSNYKFISRFHKRLKSFSGRNNYGNITVRHKINFIKKIYIHIDNFNRHFNIPFKILNIFYDSNRSSFISLIKYINGIYNYKILIYKSFINNYYYSYNNIPEYIKIGDHSILKYISPGSIISNIEIYPSNGAQLTKSAGCFALLLRKNNNKAFIKLSSNIIVQVSLYCMANIGMISNRNHRYINLGKAGRSLYNGVKPNVRGVAMNPIDHPHGGGEGKKSKSRHPRTPWGKRFVSKSIKKSKTFFFI